MYLIFEKLKVPQDGHSYLLNTYVVVNIKRLVTQKSRNNALAAKRTVVGGFIIVSEHSWPVTGHR